MGDRGQVKINGVYLYTHWGGSRLIDDVKDALRKRWRWSDEEYLARIIFDVMIGGEQGSETGYGIGTEIHGDIWRLIAISDNMISVTDYNEKVFEGTFEDFLAWEVI